MTVIPYILFWALAFYALFTPKKHILLYILFGCMPFGTFAMITPSLTGVSLTVTPFIALIVIFRTFNFRDGLDTLVDYSFSKNKLMLLFLFWVVAVFITLTMPKFFEGVIDVVPMGGNTKYDGLASPLEFTTQNITQLFYMTISVFSVYAFGKLLQDVNNRHHANSALCFGASVLIVTGFLDFSTQYSTLASLILEPFRNANYALLTDVSVLNSKRVVGLMAEASFFGNITLSFLVLIYFLRKSIRSDFLRTKIAPCLILLLLVLVWLSTSSGTYIGLAVFLIIAVLDGILRLYKQKKNKLYKRGLSAEIIFLVLFTFIILSLFLIVPKLFDPIVEMIETMVVNKADSSSYQDRSLMTLITWNAFIESYGIGVGLGSTRASNGTVVMISSVGILGAIFYYGFLMQTFLRKSFDDEYDNAMLNAIKLSFIPPFVVDFLASPTPDFGILNAFRFGFAFAISAYCLKSKVH